MGDPAPNDPIILRNRRFDPNLPIYNTPPVRENRGAARERQGNNNNNQVKMYAKLALYKVEIWFLWLWTVIGLFFMSIFNPKASKRRSGNNSIFRGGNQGGGGGGGGGGGRRGNIHTLRPTIGG